MFMSYLSGCSDLIRFGNYVTKICESVIDKALPSVSGLVELDMVYIGSLNKTMKPYGVAWCGFI